jgi:hypothetical protein
MYRLCQLYIAISKVDSFRRPLQTGQGPVTHFQHLPVGDISLSHKTKTKLHGLSPRATAACRRGDCQLFADRVCHVVSVTDPYGRILGFLDRSRYFYIK